MQDDFYKKFEDKFRGSRDEIRGRVHFYLPFIDRLLNHYSSLPVVDLGCGRGEWLELLSFKNIAAIGFDIDAQMLAVPKKLGLNVNHEDALQALKKMPKASAIAVTGFHIAEHLDFDVLKELVSESLRVLVPGGLLILETPNPENVQVGSCSFYLDPTHLRPLPPALLAFIPEYYGFKRCIIARLQENKELLNNKRLTLNEVIQGVSPDYAVIAQKTAKKTILKSFDDLFDVNYGLTFSELSNRFDELIKSEIETPQKIVNAIQTEWDQAKSKSSDLAQELSALRIEKAQLEGLLSTKQKELEDSWAGFAEKQKQVDEALTSNHHNWVLANQNEHALNQQREINSILKAELSDLQELYQQKINESYYWHGRVLEVHNSVSWKITKPIRIFNRIKLKNERNRIPKVDGFDIKSYLLLKAFSFLSRHPKLRSTAINVLKVFPSIESFLKVERGSLLKNQIKRESELVASPDLKMHDLNDGHFLTVCDGKLAVDQILSNIRKELNLGDDLNK